MTVLNPGTVFYFSLILRSSSGFKSWGTVQNIHYVIE